MNDLPDWIKPKKRLFVSFSGGRTSAYMSWWLKNNLSHLYDMIFVFSNTAQEHPQTLEFVQKCDFAFGLNVVWLEADVHFNTRKRSGFKVVDFFNASREGQPFENVIRKYGIPNSAYPHCTRELKLNPMYEYVNSIWPDRDYDIAVGIRADEQQRRRKDAESVRIVYPLMDWIPTDKSDINEWWEGQDFQLNLPERLGNCTWCWKKTDIKHFQNIKDVPEFYDFPARMEQTHGSVKTDDNHRVFFRKNRSTETMRRLAEAVDPIDHQIERQDENSGCSESCEAFGQ